MPERRHRSFVRPLIIAGALIAATARVAASHDFWIVPVSFLAPPGAPLEVRGQTGTAFPQSVSAVTADRIAEARLIDAGSEERLTDFSVAGKSLLIRHRPTAPGQRVVAVALVPRVSPQSAAGFERYLRLEGAASVADAYQRSAGLPKDSVRMRVTKAAKTILEVGSRGPRAFSRPAGHVLEIVPISDPAAARVGDTLALRVLFRGQPLREAAVVAGWAPYGAPWEGATTPPPTASGTAAAPERHDTQMRTDSAGIVRVALNRDGMWNARLVNAAPSAAGSGADWDVYFATLVFGIGVQPAGDSPRSSSRDTATDSPAVAAVVTGFHDALAAGDSSRALSLLDSSVVILESGDEEHLAEYRAHHLPADIEFARAVRATAAPLRVAVRGDVAWATGTSTTTGTFRGRTINSSGAELMVLTRGAAGWRIVAIHWSSHTRRAP